ncbi:MAG TPA: glycosyltransferase family 9 protein [Candidatus Hydrogenedentes bacterium]|nr:glycosyltransferase family 9 protein [Candidatus Hydrogenedentota bacterium]
MINGIPRILIIRLSAIGDVVRVLPALQALRDRYPNAQIDWAIERKSAEVILDHPALDQCLVFERSAGWLKGSGEFRAFCKRIRDGRYDVVLDFHGIMKSGLITRASKAPKRYGFRRPRAQEFSYFFTNQRVALPFDRMNRIEENLELCKVLDAINPRLDAVIYIPDEVQDEVDEYLAQTFDSGKRLVVLHAPIDRPEKQWPLESYAALADLLLADGRFEVVLTWGPGQRHLAEQVQELSRRKPVIAPGLPSLKHYAGLVYHAALYVGGDTGPMHIASIMGTPVVAIFGGTDPARHAPLRRPSEALYAGPDPFPKSMDLATAQKCLEAITPDIAYDASIRVSCS